LSLKSEIEFQISAFRFQTSDTAKLLLAAGMLLGRLELFTILVLFSRAFGRGEPYSAFYPKPGLILSLSKDPLFGNAL
jgi:hypothetical protein